MPTVIDALIVTLGLDPTNFTKGQREAGAAIIKTREEVQRSGKEIELSARSIGNFVGQLRNQFVTLFATVAAGRGLSSFASDLVQTGAAVGRMSALLGTTTEKLSAWQGVGSAFGGTAQGIASSIGTLNQSLQQLSLTGDASFIPYLRALQAHSPGANLGLQGMNGEIRTAIDLLPDLHKAFQGMSAARAQAIGHGLGLSDDLINVLIQSDEVFAKFMQDQQRWGTVTKEQAKASQDLQYITNGLYQSFATLGRVLLVDVAPVLTRVIKVLTDKFIELRSNPELLRNIAIGFTVIATALSLLALGPMGLVVAGITAISTALYLLYDDWTTYNEGGKAKFGEFWQSVNDGWAKIRAQALEVWDDIKGYVIPVIEALKVIFDGWIKTTVAGFQLIGALFVGTADDIRKAWSDLIAGLSRLWSGFADNLVTAIVNIAPTLFDAIKKAMGQAFDWVFERLNTVIEAIGGKPIQNPFTGGGPTTGNFGPGAGQGAGDSTVNYSGASAPGYDKKNDSKLFDDVDFFVSKGWTREQAIGIVANIADESRGSHTAIGDGGKAFGLAQWHADRRANFKKVFGIDMEQGTREQQREFIHWELTNTERRAGDALRRATSATQAADIITRQYERPKWVDADSLKRQMGAAAIARLPRPAPGSAPGAPTVAQTNSSNVANDNSRQSQTSVGTVNIVTQATDAAGIAKDIKPALERDGYAADANNGYM